MGLTARQPVGNPILNSIAVAPDQSTFSSLDVLCKCNGLNIVAILKHTVFHLHVQCIYVETDSTTRRKEYNQEGWQTKQTPKSILDCIALNAEANPMTV